MRVVLRPSLAEDFIALIGHPPAHRVKAITALADDHVIGIGGLVFMPSGQVWASVEMIDDARKYRVAIHRAGLMAMAQAKRDGFKVIFATAKDGLAGAGAWLERLGFVPHARDGLTIYRWEAR